MKKKKNKQLLSSKTLIIGQGFFIFSLISYTIYYSEYHREKRASNPQTSTSHLYFIASSESSLDFEKESERLPEFSMQEDSRRTDISRNTSFLLADASETLPKKSDKPVLKDSPCLALLTIRNTEGRGIGYNHGYSTLEGLIFPIHTDNNLWPFLDLRFHYFNNNEFSANGGIGVRYNADKQKIIYGLNVYYDYRSDHHQSLNFNQIGFGFELLWKQLDFRLNGYLPLEKEKTVKRSVFSDPSGEYISAREQVRVALSGLNAEFGRSIVKVKNLTIYGAIGPYYYRANDFCNTFGGQFRLNMRIAKYITLEGRVTYDHLFNTRGEGIIGLNFPLGCPKSNKSTQNRLTQHVQRNEIIVLDKFIKWKTNF